MEQLFAQLTARVACEAPSMSVVIALHDMDVSDTQQSLFKAKLPHELSADEILLANIPIVKETKKIKKRKRTHNRLGEQSAAARCLNNPERTTLGVGVDNAKASDVAAKDEKKNAKALKEGDLIAIMKKFGWTKPKGESVRKEDVVRFIKANYHPLTGPFIQNGPPKSAVAMKREEYVEWVLAALKATTDVSPLIDLTKLHWKSAPAEYLITSKQIKVKPIT